MKVLIDGFVFTQEFQPDAADLWRETIPRLVSRLRGAQVYYLNRTSEPNFPEVQGIINLFAPTIDLNLSAIEDRRLAALCRELAIDVFISTYYTSAGSGVKSLLVVWKPSPTFSQAAAGMFSLRQRAVRLACSYLAIVAEGADYIKSIGNVQKDSIRIVYPPTNADLDWMIIANYCAKAILELSDRKPSPEVAARQLAEEEATKAEAAILRSVVYGREAAAEYSASQSHRVEEAIAEQLQSVMGADKIADLSSSTDEIDRLIPAEIKNDELYAAIERIAREENIKTVLEIGSSSGEGSTKAFVTGIRANPSNPILFCIEASKPRFIELLNRYAKDDFVKCYNVSSVSVEDLPEEREIVEFYNNTRTALNKYPLYQVLGWLRQGREHLRNTGVTEKGIQKIKRENEIDFFDVVLIDGSEFTGSVELPEVYGAKWLLLDDINTFKNYKNYRSLLADINYTLVEKNLLLRNGYSVFKKIDNAVIDKDFDLPLHLFTIVLNGQPFIRYHIDLFEQLPFKWHWHIIEGVADLKHDTAWCLQRGGQITDEIHRNGRSNDGTSEYLDELARLYPENITVYRKPEGVFWEGKREMVNAPLANIQEECLLWQVDVDELWTLEQICTARKMFVNNPDKTAAFYWCWYFVGENLVISTRNCYAQNPKQDWLRTWKFKPGMSWAAHEPPILVEPQPDSQGRNVAAVNPFRHEETEKEGLVFQHFAYVTPDQLKFKEKYYGYQDAVSQWIALQNQTQFPVLLREYFSWVQDETRVDTASACGVVPIAQKDSNSNLWRFGLPEELYGGTFKKTRQSPTIVIDGVFFQLYKTGIARVWNSLLSEWGKHDFAKHIVVLDRVGTAPKIPGIWYRTVPAYDYSRTDADREMLQQVCDEEGAELFISTYYTTPLSTPSVFMGYDMIPERLGANINEPMWREKHRSIQEASGYITISENTARDLVKFFPNIRSVTVAHCGVKSPFTPASSEEINGFKTKYGIGKPYFLLVGPGTGYKNTILFFKAFSKLCTYQGFEIVGTGRGGLLASELRSYTSGVVVHMLQLSDEELSVAYSGAIALVYPSKYEGFGLPVLEAMACGCPVITSPNASIPEVAGEAAIYVHDEDVDGLVNALCEVQKPGVRNSSIAAGLEQAKKFSWSRMAEKVSSALMDATLLGLNLKDVNIIIFPDWSAPEESLGEELAGVFKTVITHPDKTHMTLLVDTSNISDEDADAAISSVVMSLLMSEDLDVDDGPEITLIGQLSDMQWELLLSRIHSRIGLENENQEAIARVKATNIPCCELDNLSQLGSASRSTSAKASAERRAGSKN